MHGSKPHTEPTTNREQNTCLQSLKQINHRHTTWNWRGRDYYLFIGIWVCILRFFSKMDRRHEVGGGWVTQWRAEGRVRDIRVWKRAIVSTLKRSQTAKQSKEKAYERNKRYSEAITLFTSQKAFACAPSARAKNQIKKIDSLFLIWSAVAHTTTGSSKQIKDTLRQIRSHQKDPNCSN